ncbi:MAG: 16S rRNA (cytosine(1402)-N(4))-methyltransferase RsmH [Flavobacteriales bacterium]|nr:16S rRNA (cytosine(1402)-N(4))-methyltransferase RsmH [Flavobacteriales bacterium]
MNYHNPVLLNQSIEGLNIKENGIYVDVTFGGGGHSKEILKQMKNGRLYAFDQDGDAANNTIDDERFLLIRQNFKHLKNNLRQLKVTGIDGILADLGVSSYQFDTPERGFSIRFNEELDMRMNNLSDKTALDILSAYSQDELADVFWKYGDLRNSRNIARNIIAYRKHNELKKLDDLKEALGSALPKGKENKFLAKLFQALRIEVNDEMNALKELLTQSKALLNKEGRLVVISYHSLEDRLVKNFIRSGNIEGNIEQDLYGNTNSGLKMISRKAIAPTSEEIESNPRARSAKLRIAEKI